MNNKYPVNSSVPLFVQFHVYYIGIICNSFVFFRNSYFDCKLYRHILPCCVASDMNTPCLFSLYYWDARHKLSKPILYIAVVLSLGFSKTNVDETNVGEKRCFEPEHYLNDPGINYKRGVKIIRNEIILWRRMPPASGIYMWKIICW